MRLTIIVSLGLLSLARSAEDIPDINKLGLEDKEVLAAEETVQRQATSEERRLLSSDRLLPTESSTQQPTVEYADDEGKHSQDTQAQTFVTPAPRIAKISDVLTTQGVPYPTAIENHLISPVSIYQSRLPATPAYDVSPPIPAQLAYSEHRVYQPPTQQNSLQYYPEKKQIPNNGFISTLPLNLNFPGAQQNLQYYQSVIPQQQPHLIRLPQQQIFQYQIPPLQYNQPQNLDQQRPVQYTSSQQQPLYNIVFNRHNNLPPGITYARPEENASDNRYPTYSQPQQHERSEPQGTSNQLLNIRQNIPNVDKSQGAVSYASFSQSPPSYVPQRPVLQQAYAAQKQEPQNININLIPNGRLLPIQSTPFIFRTQQNSQNYPLQNIQQLPPVQQLQPVQQIQHPVQHLPQQQIQYIPRHQVPGNLPSPSQQYVLQIPEFQQYQPLQQPQIIQIQPNYDPRPQQGYSLQEQNQQRPQTAPNYLPVQYFGKFAERIFARYNMNEKK